MAEGQLNWRDYLNSEYVDVPLHALRYSACSRLALYLDNQDMLIHNGIVPNFGGLAELVGFDSLEIDNMVRAKSPTKQLFDDWKSRPELKPTVGRFVEFLAILGREDVLTDCHKIIGEDVRIFLERPQQFDKIKTAPIQDQTVSQGPGFEEIPTLITRQDVINGCETFYDAFVCYNPSGNSSKDLEFIKQLIRRFEGSKYGFHLFVPYRDDLPGLSAHSVNAKIISERCRHMIVVLSPNFLSSPACDFQSTFAHALSPGARNKRIIPIKIENCPTPNILRIMACCDFTKRDLWDWSWDRLAKSIMIPLSREDYQVSWLSSLDGMIRSSNFDLTSTLESGVGSMSDSPVSSRSASPTAHLRQNITELLPARPAEIHRQNVTERHSPNNTVPISSTQPKSASPSERIRTFFTNKKPKTKTDALTSDS